MLLDYESDAIAAEKAGDAVQYIDPQADDPDPDADRGHRARARTPTQAQAFVNWQWSRGGPDDLGPAGLPAGDAVGGQAVRRASSRPRRSCSRSTTSAAGRRSRTSSSTPTTDRSRRSSRRRGCPLPPADAYAVPAAAPPSRRRRVPARSRPRRRSAWAWRSLYMSVIVLIPLAAVVVKAFSQGPGDVLALGHEQRRR